MKIFARTGDKEFPISHPLICLYRWPFKLKTVFLVTLQRRRLKKSLELSLGSLLCVQISSRMWSMVSSRGTSVKSDETSYETRTSSSLRVSQAQNY